MVNEKKKSDKPDYENAQKGSYGYRAHRFRHLFWNLPFR